MMDQVDHLRFAMKNLAAHVAGMVRFNGFYYDRCSREAGKKAMLLAAFDR